MRTASTSGIRMTEVGGAVIDASLWLGWVDSLNYDNFG